MAADVLILGSASVGATGPAASYTGTGVPHVAGGITSGAASLIVDADIDPDAAMAVSKLAPGTNTQVLTTLGGVPVWHETSAGATASYRTVCWRPGGATTGYFFSDYEDIQAIIDDAEGNITVLVDDSVAESDLPSGAWDCWGRVRFDSADPQRNAIMEIGFQPNGCLLNPAIISRLGVYKEHNDGMPAIGLTRDGVIRFDNVTTFWNEQGTDQPMIEITCANAQLIFLEAANVYTQHAGPTRGFIRLNRVGGVFLYYAISNQLGIPMFPTQLENTAGAADIVYIAADASVIVPPQTVFTGTLLHIRSDYAALCEPSKGTTAARPASPTSGEMYFDTTLSRPIWWTGADWINASGTPV